jgi:hypothetical protein
MEIQPGLNSSVQLQIRYISKGFGLVNEILVWQAGLCVIFKALMMIIMTKNKNQIVSVQWNQFLNQRKAGLSYHGEVRQQEWQIANMQPHSKQQ